MLTELLLEYTDHSRFTKKFKHHYVIPSDSIDNLFFYRIDCLGGIPLVVFLYDRFGVEGIERYRSIKIPHCLHINNGIYPLTVEIIELFCKYYIETLNKCTYIGCWNKGYIPELYLIDKYCTNKAVDKPYNSGHEGSTIWFNRENWYHKLQNQKLLIISSHANSMCKQWESNNLFKSHGSKMQHQDTGIEITFIKPPISICGLTPHNSWKDSLDQFKQEIDKIMISQKIDLALVSCGSYSSPICSYIYDQYHKSVFYIGGALQLYFSIIGNRWNNKSFINEYWTRLEPSEIPVNAHLIENACYY